MKKIFFVSISMLPVDKLVPVYYGFEGEETAAEYKSCYPSIPLMERNIAKGDEVKIVAVRTDDDNERTAANFAVFEKELTALSQKMGITLAVSETVTVPHNENKAKLVSLLKALSAAFVPDAEVYMDVTYGTKVTSIELFTSLVYGAKVKNCDIKSVVYGKFNHGENAEQGTIFDIRCLYDIANLIYAADHLPAEQLDALLDRFW